MEHLDGGSLDSYFEKAPQNSQTTETLLRICLEITAGMIYLESQGVVHRDLAARNVLVSKDLKAVKVSDFGLATILESAYYNGSKEKPLPVKWCAPEVIKRRRYSSKSDVWSLGVTFWEVFSEGEIPYGLMTNQEAFYFVCSGSRLEKPDACPNEMYELMLKCWDADFEKIPAFEKVWESLDKMKLQ